ncbi:hypothetical protein Vafri_20771, partial [Volvox africanus]
GAAAGSGGDGSGSGHSLSSLERRRLMLSSVSNLVQLRDTVAEDGNLTPRNKQALLNMIEDALEEQRQQQPPQPQQPAPCSHAAASPPAFCQHGREQPQQQYHIHQQIRQQQPQRPQQPLMTTPQQPLLHPRDPTSRPQMQSQQPTPPGSELLSCGGSSGPVQCSTASCSQPNQSSAWGRSPSWSSPSQTTHGSMKRPMPATALDMHSSHTQPISVQQPTAADGAYGCGAFAPAVRTGSLPLPLPVTVTGERTMEWMTSAGIGGSTSAAATYENRTASITRHWRQRHLPPSLKY